MKNYFFSVGIILLLFSCRVGGKVEPNLGLWKAELQVMDAKRLPFVFELTKSVDGTYAMEIFNAEEKIKVDEIEIIDDSITIRTPVFEGYIAGKFSKNLIEGQFIKESLDRVVPFKAYAGKRNRFEVNTAAGVDISGIWEAEFSKNTSDSYMAKGIFSQTGNTVQGTFRTTTGDYRYLEGVVDGDSLKLSVFDGAHAFLFTAKISDSLMNGVFYSGNHFKEPFVAKRNGRFELPDPDSLTFLKDGYDKLRFSFPDETGNMVSLDDVGFEDKVVVVQIMGTWCPNCLDETKFLVDYKAKNKYLDVEVIGLAFEYAKTKEKAFKSIERLRKRIAVNYPIVLAQFGTSDKSEAQEKLPMLNHILSYPTTIFVDRKGMVRKIHTGFNGPATGEKYELFKREFDEFVQQLLAE